MCVFSRRVRLRVSFTFSVSPFEQATTPACNYCCTDKKVVSKRVLVRCGRCVPHHRDLLYKKACTLREKPLFALFSLMILTHVEETLKERKVLEFCGKATQKILRGGRHVRTHAVSDTPCIERALDERSKKSPRGGGEIGGGAGGRETNGGCGHPVLVIPPPPPPLLFLSPHLYVALPVISFPNNVF